jgi:hypothetical protein
MYIEDTCELWSRLVSYDIDFTVNYSELNLWLSQCGDVTHKETYFAYDLCG